MGPEFFLQTLLGLVINEVWDFTIDKIKKVYKEHKDVPEKQKTFQSRMYTAIIDAFCVYTGVNPDEAQDDVMDFICRTALEYYDQSYKKQDTTTDTLLSAINTLESRFGNTLLVKKDVEDKQKISVISDYLQVYIANDPGFRHIYVIKSLDDLKNKGQQYEEKQLDLKLFAEEAIQNAVFRINNHTDQVGNRVIAVFKEEFNTFKNLFYAAGASENMSSNPVTHKFYNEKEKYANKWNERLFLHRRPEDEDLTLGNTFVMPAYYLLSISPFEPSIHIIEEIRYLTTGKIKDLKGYDNLEEVFNQFVIDGSSMLILGQPGMGKSSIVCYLANKYINDSQLLIVKFKDLKIKKSIDQSMDNKSLLLDSILNYFYCEKKDLENRTLILDGYDEIDSYFFNIDLFSDFFLSIRDIKNFKILITSRENYMIKEVHCFRKIILLLPFDAGKIEKFAEHITHDKFVAEYIIDDNNKVFGIPVILYMALATGVDLSRTISRIGVYNKIFSLNGGIFDRFYSQNNDSYETGSHTISYVKNAFYNILCNTAFYMFENFSDNSIPHNAYEKIIEIERTKTKELLAKSSQFDSPLWYDFPIENLYEKTDTISFIHKSFYEYFVAEYFFAAIYSMSKNIIKQNLYANENEEKCNKIISELSNLFSQNAFSAEIVEYLQYKINANFCRDEIEILQKFYIHIFKRMLANGMTYKLSQSIKHSTLQAECVIFANMLDFIHLWIKCDFPTEYIEFNIKEIDQIVVYLYLWSFMNIPTNSAEHKALDYINDNHISLYSWNFKLYKRLNLSHFNLERINLQHIDLCNIDFDRSNMSRSVLNGAVLMNSSFCYTQFHGSLLKGADLSSSFFKKTIFVNSNITNANFENSIVFDTDFTGCTAKNALFRNVHGLDSAIYNHELDDAILD